MVFQQVQLGETMDSSGEDLSRIRIDNYGQIYF